MPFESYPPALRAEDNFRLSLFPQHRNCLWKATADNIVPRSWSENSTKKKHAHSRKIYNDHLEILNKAFMNSESPFELKYSETEGIGIYCKQDLTIKEYNEKYKDLIVGFTTNIIEGSTHFSEVEIKIKKRRLGRPPKDKKQSNKIYSLYGPISFANHACQSKHASFNLRKNNESEDMFLKMNRNLKKGDQVTISYGFGRHSNVSCNYCKARKKLTHK